MPAWNNLQIPGKAGDAQLSQQLLSNMIMFMDSALLNLGYFMNVNLDTVYPYGGNPSTLRLSSDNRYTAGVAWDAFKTNFVWETGIEFDSQPINISGIYVNSEFWPLDNSPTGYHINYPAGRVIFDSPIGTNSTVQAEYSFKYYNIYPNTIQWFRQLTEGTWRVDDQQWSTNASGIWSTFPESRAQLPAVVVEVSPKTSMTPLGLGGGQWVSKDVLIHVFSENGYDRDNLIDILSYQWQKRLFLIDKNRMSASGAFPLSAYGYLVNPSSTYTYLVNNYGWRDCYVEDISVQRTDNNPQSVYYGVARWTLKVNMPDII